MRRLVYGLLETEPECLSHCRAIDGIFDSLAYFLIRERRGRVRTVAINIIVSCRGLQYYKAFGLQFGRLLRTRAHPYIRLTRFHHRGSRRRVLDGNKLYGIKIRKTGTPVAVILGHFEDDITLEIVSLESRG